MDLNLSRSRQSPKSIVNLTSFGFIACVASATILTLMLQNWYFDKESTKKPSSSIFLSMAFWERDCSPRWEDEENDVETTSYLLMDKDSKLSIKDYAAWLHYSLSIL